MRQFFKAVGILAILVVALPHIANAQTTPPQKKIDDLVRLLQDPELKAWLEAKKPDDDVEAKPKIGAGLADWELATRARIRAVGAAVPRIPEEILSAASRVHADAVAWGYAPVMVIFVVIVAIGSVAERSFRYTRTKRNDHDAGAATALPQLLPIVIFAAVTAVIFFAVEWPPLARIALFAYLIAFIAYRILSVLAGVAIDGNAALRSRTRLFLGIVAIATAASELGAPLGVDPSVSDALSYCFSLTLLAIAMETTWRTSSRSIGFKIALTFSALGLWLLWCLDLKGLFWIGIYILILPPVLSGVGRAVEVAVSQNGRRQPDDMRGVMLVRGARAIILALAVAWIAFIWHVNPDSLVHQNSNLTAVLYGLLKSVIILLVADLLWQLARSFIDRELASTAETAGLPSSEAARRGRMRTLLPIFRNVLAVFVIVMVALIVLSQLGVEIGPLIAGAGIFGVALGFGSQALVKDVISGVFYMFDDAFRVGEYIQAKSYMGTVEGFSLRSVRLRHHRGPVFTVPFGELGAVQNMSRDWVIDKFKITVGFDTDINRARKIAKTIGADLQADPDMGPMFIAPLKMKGVESFSDYGIVLSFAMTTVPGQQSSIRRKAYAMIRDAFQANGIEFATPSVQVGSEDNRGGAAAAATTMRAAEIKANQEKGES